jgi:DNA-binding response OmpR family regulator
LTKPFSFAELLARLHALIRRANHESDPTRFAVGDLSLDLLTREVSRGDVKIDLQPREFALLELLMRHNGQVISKTMIIEQVWGYSYDPMTNIVDVLVSRLRNKIDRDFDTKLIQTYRGVGYALKLP